MENVCHMVEQIVHAKNCHLEFVKFQTNHYCFSLIYCTFNDLQFSELLLKIDCTEL